MSNFIFRLTTGDRSGDGHGKFDSHYFVVESNRELEPLELTLFFKRAQSNLGFNFQHHCNDYESSTINASIFDKVLTQLGYETSEVEDSENPFAEIYDSEGDWYYSFNDDGWTLLALEFIKFEARKEGLELNFITFIYNETLDIGGYGLYYS